jgi:hypothetical protein
MRTSATVVGLTVTTGMRKMNRKMAVKASVCLVGATLALVGCTDTRSKPRPALQRSQSPETDCRKVGDKICEVPQKDGKIVLMCFKGPWPHSVKARWECR